MGLRGDKRGDQVSHSRDSLELLDVGGFLRRSEQSAIVSATDASSKRRRQVKSIFRVELRSHLQSEETATIRMLINLSNLRRVKSSSEEVTNLGLF